MRKIRETPSCQVFLTTPNEQLTLTNSAIRPLYITEPRMQFAMNMLGEAMRGFAAGASVRTPPEELVEYIMQLAEIVTEKGLERGWITAIPPEQINEMDEKGSGAFGFSSQQAP